MPSNLPSSFASAAAGQNTNSRGGRTDGRGATSGDWAKRDGRSTNGTLTFRRSSTTPLGQPSSQPPPSTDHAVQHPATESPVSASASTYEVSATRYTKDELLDMFRPQKPGEDATHLFAPGWNPGQVNGHAPRGWGKSNDNHIPQEPGACWDDTGDITPMGLHDMSLEEKETFNTEINSPLKPPTQNKDTHQGATNGRKASLSQGASNTFGVSSPSSATRPGTRRRETIESNPFGGSALASPTAAGRFSREDPTYWFTRSKTDLKESEPEESDTDPVSREAPGRLPPFGNLMRSNTGGIGGVGSMWPPSNQTTPGAGGFGNFALASSPAVGDKRVGGAGAGGSRLAHLIPKDSSDNLSGKAAESQSPLNQQSWRSRPRTDTDPFGDDTLSGSAVLGGAQDTDTGGMPQQSNRAGTLGTPIKGSAGDFGMAGLNLGSHGDDGPVSPSETNPYRSPPAERHGHDDNDTHDDKPHGANLHDAPSNFGSIGRGFGGYDGGDRSQTSSVGAKGYPSLNTLAGWPAPGGPAIGTPDRERPNLGSAFGNSLFSPMGDLQSPGLSNLGNVFGPASAGGLGTGSIGRGSKISSLFPAAMQAQMQSHEQQHDNNLADSLPDLRQGNPLGAIGRTNFGIPSRDTESPMRPNRGVFEELFPSSDASRAQGVFSTGDSNHPTTATAPQSFTPIGGGLPFGGQGSTEPPATQVRQMVMPDRMRWVYLDPQGQVQGPFTGLEMNDWYKANFFTPDLRVKKLEDSDFEPLGQLIRRIGNSREPFLVPQIGIPHGPPSQAGPFSPQGNSGVVPPLSGVFPSFGRTLTAEEQNNLERRKQEEQYLMVQQREYVMRAQAMSKFPIPGPMLQHHSSAHSLQSQPSFGSISSPNPIGMPHQQPIGAMPPSGAFFDGAGPVGSQTSAPSGSGNGDPFRDDDLTSYANSERQILASLQGAGASQPIRAPGADTGARAGLPDTQDLEQDDEGFKERLQEFENYQAQLEAEQAAKAAEGSEEEPAEESSPTSEAVPEETRRRAEVPVLTGKAARAARKKAAEDALSLTQQVQQTQAAAAAAAAAAAQPVEPDMPMPFPPPASTGTPLPAPTAQRARSNLPEQYNRSQTGTPDSVANAQPPPLAPWAKDHGAESHKGPSLKEIQEAEARKAAKAEEAAAAQRKAVLEQEAAALREREKTAAVTNAGLPATSTWGHGSPAPSASPWSKPGPSKTAAVSTPSASTSSNKKTLADIQREEELRKQKAIQASPQSVTPTASVSKSYANLAGKPGQSTLTNAASAAAAAAMVPPPGSGWATVGAGGKVKVPTGPSSQARSVSATSMKPITSPVKSVSKPAALGNGKAEAGNAAMEEFNKWVTREISRGINTADTATFQTALDNMPLDTSIIADAVYSISTTMDGRHFAEEFVRRKGLAERGVVEKQPENKGGSSGGWSEVAKKGSSSNAAAAAATSPREDTSMQGGNFKVVPSRKKSKK